MADLVGVALPASDTFVAALATCWDNGDAVLPVDLRLPETQRSQLLSAMGAARLIDASGEHVLDGGEPVETGDALVVPTSGSTGTPKGVVLTHAAVQAAAGATSAAVGADPATDRWLCCLPVAHLGGLGVVTRALLTGTPLELHQGFDAQAVTASATRGATLVSLVATAMRRIDTSVFRTIVLGGSAIPPDRPSNSVATYGLTESCGGVVYDGVPIDGVEMRIDPTGPGGSEIQLRGPMLLRGYRNAPTPLTEDGWLRTGDIGSISANGVLSVQGRAGDLIITGGEKVWPASVEAVLAAHPSIAAVAVIGREDPEWGQTVTAVVEPVSGQEITLDEVRSTVKAELPAWCAPRRLELRELPRTSLGKVVRKGL